MKTNDGVLNTNNNKKVIPTDKAYGPRKVKYKVKGKRTE